MSKHNKKYWTAINPRIASIGRVQNLLSRCGQALIRWSHQKGKNREKKIRKKFEFLKLLQDKEDEYNVPKIKQFQEELGVLFEQEEIKWRQHVKRNWYQKGDKNTRFFHACES